MPFWLELQADRSSRFVRHHTSRIMCTDPEVPSLNSLSAQVYDARRDNGRHPTFAGGARKMELL